MRRLQRVRSEVLGLAAGRYPMSRNLDTFIALGSPAVRVLAVLENLIDFSCSHTDTEHTTTAADCEPKCERVTLENLAQAAVRISDMIQSGELGPSP